MKYSIVIYILFLFACTKSRTLDLKPEKKQLVVSCTFNPDSTWKLWLSSTISIGEQSDYFPAINNANVQLFENGNAIGAMQNIGDGYYTLGANPHLGNIYSIKISATGFDNVEAMDSFPKTKGLLLNGSVEKILVEKKAPPPWVDEFQKALPVKMVIFDSKSENNFYKIQAYIIPSNPNQYPQYFMDSGYTIYPNRAITSNDKRFESLSWGQTQLLFSDIAMQDSINSFDAYYWGFGRRHTN